MANREPTPAGVYWILGAFVVFLFIAILGLGL